jgi:superfamily II DNA or RNA helicase
MMPAEIPSTSPQKRIPITRKRLETWAGAQVVREAQGLVDQGAVLKADYEPPYITGTLIHTNREFKTRMRILRDGNVESECPCYANRERGIICTHVIALGLVIASRQRDPEREQKHREEVRRANRLAAISEELYIKRAPYGASGTTPATVKVVLDPAWMEGVEADAITVHCLVSFQGHDHPIDKVPEGITLGLNKRDESLLFVLEDICEGPARPQITLNRRDFMNLLQLLADQTIVDTDDMPVTIHRQSHTSTLAMTMNDNTGNLILSVITELPHLPTGEEPFYVVSGNQCWAYGADHFWPIKNVLPTPYHEIYQNPITISREHVLRFMQGELSLLTKHADLQSEISLDLFTVDPAAPTFRLEIHGSPASLSATLYAVYTPVELVASKPDAREHFAIPDPDDMMRYMARNKPAEKDALVLLANLGFRGETGDSLNSIVGSREVLNFLGGSIPALRRQGWQIDLHGRVEPFFEKLPFATPVVKVDQDTQGRWFDIGFDFEADDGASISQAEIHNALRKGDAWIERNGNPVLIDTPAVESMLDVFSDCDSSEADTAGHFRLSTLYAPFVKSSLDALDGIDVDDVPTWRKQAEQSNRTLKVARTPLPESLETILRPYQKEGVDWLRFLEQNQFCGLLADEMGLGKTLQTLTWLQLNRLHPQAQECPSMVICPTSLVQNWVEEAARFAPQLRVLAISGAQRQEQLEQIEDHDLVVTSYSLLRRDIAQYLNTTFSAVVLDEAQHIKNRSTRNAQAAKQLRASHRLVLTGTPVENGVSDIWSIMDFLMPGYLGNHDSFRQSYELPIAKGGPDADLAQRKLRRKLHPFLLRRLKRHVAKELPPKIESISSCELSSDQRVVYKEILEHSKRRIADLVDTQGFNRARMEILTTLLKLRQICCHLDLLKLDNIDAKQPSAKLDLFLELVDEAIDGGHRILVFSQFVSMLHILREQLKARGISFCYLDGSTKDRMEQVHRFNTDRSIPIFLISLKAGGTGLNLTGADMVIHYDPWWNPAVENQATDRAYRIGQKRTVYSVKLITKGTIEEKVVEMQKRKRDIIDATVESDEAMLTSMSWEDVQELLEL